MTVDINWISGSMLETSEERARLIRKGIAAKKIEELYVQSNKYKIIYGPILFVDIEKPYG
jgi:hypothetical protein